MSPFLGLDFYVFVNVESAFGRGNPVTPKSPLPARFFHLPACRSAQALEPKSPSPRVGLWGERIWIVCAWGGEIYLR